MEVAEEVKIYVFPADLGGCGYYRLIWPAEVLRAAGHRVNIVHPQDRDRALQARVNGDAVTSVRLPADADVVVFQRVTHRYLAQAISVIRAQNIAVVIDMDDDLTCIHPANPAFHMLHPTGPNPAHAWHYTQVACDNATLVTVSTPALADRYGRRAPARVLYNMVPARYLDVLHEDSDLVGWAGSVHSHPTDLQVVGPAVAQLLQAGHRFKVIGPPTGIHQALGVPIARKIESTGVIGIETWPLALSGLGIGIAPLADSRFNAAKSWLKPLEYAAAGVPCLASPRAEYARLAKLGVGWLARDHKDWRRKLKTLTEDQSLRTELSERGRAVARRHTIEENAWRWLEVWSEALELQRSGALASSSTP